MLRCLILLLSLLVCSPVYGAVDFDGSDDDLNFGANKILDDGTATFGCAAKLDVVTTDQTIMGTWQGGNVTGHILQFDDSGSCGTDRYGYFFRESGGSNGYNLCGGTTITAGVWHSVIVTVNTTSAELFLDGVSDGTSTSNGGGDMCNSTECNGTAYIGQSGGESRFFNGEITDCFKYGVVLSDNEIAQIAKSQLKRRVLDVSPANLDMYIPMDDYAAGTSVDGSTFIDMSGNGVTATGDDGANNTGMSATSESYLSYL